MSVPENVDPGAHPGLFSSLRSFWGVLIAILCTRLDLATVELEEVGAHLARLVVLSLAALLCVSMTIFFCLFFLVVTFWNERVWILGIISIVGILTSIVLGLAARSMVLHRPKFLAQTLAELRRDVEGLRAFSKTDGAKS